MKNSTKQEIVYSLTKDEIKMMAHDLKKSQYLALCLYQLEEPGGQKVVVMVCTCLRVTLQLVYSVYRYQSISAYINVNLEDLSYMPLQYSLLQSNVAGEWETLLCPVLEPMPTLRLELLLLQV